MKQTNLNNVNMDNVWVSAYAAAFITQLTHAVKTCEYSENHPLSGAIDNTSAEDAIIAADTAVEKLMEWKNSHAD